jgi:hypothetical protein
MSRSRQQPRRASSRRPAPHKRRPRVVAKAGTFTVSDMKELRALRRQLARAGVGSASPLRWNADPDEVRRSVARLVLTLVEFVRRMLERQAIRRMDTGTFTSRETEDVGRALMQLETTIREIALTFGIPPEELNLDLGPAGKLM